MALGKAAPVRAERGLCKMCRSGKRKKGSWDSGSEVHPCCCHCGLVRGGCFYRLSSESPKDVPVFYWVLLWALSPLLVSSVLHTVLIRNAVKCKVLKYHAVEVQCF